ncbi:MAG: hypothetical protein GYB26_04195 [Gammaproteobacteria bacterium]|uniref:Lipoprotein n=1 Tax=Marinobacter litoralis TaxID=187981 RepID=A0A3M2RCD8_9GAMM|nr:hypothetical protein [Marinobacter litoralis]MBR9870318.1 hypothetical protein [Gammaproteobacteria bacterium]RMJ02824.1 hypothetical protein DOQ08_02288 [Marinobacter litoralis]
MRSVFLYATISMAFATVTGCGSDSSGSSALNPASDVDLTFSTFDLTNTPQAPETLEHTLFNDYYSGIEPSGTDATPENRETAKDIRRHIDNFIGATPAEDGKSYTRVRNPLDLMNQVISVGEVDNFDDGRQYISDRIGQSTAGTYNTRSAGASIRFTDQAATNTQQALNDREWRYQTLDWRYVPKTGNESSLDEKVYRTIQYIARSVDTAQQDRQPELVSLLAGARFSAPNFSASGYNKPELATADFVSRNHGGIELRQEFIGEEQKDTLFIKNSKEPVIDYRRHGVILEEANPDCQRVELNYAMSKVQIYTSNDEPSRIQDPEANPDDYENSEDVPTVPNPDYCVNQSEDQAKVVWNTVPTAHRQ